MAYGGRRQHDMGKDYKSMQEFLDGQADFTLDEMFNTLLSYRLRMDGGPVNMYDGIFLEARHLMECRGFNFFEPIAFAKLAETRRIISAVAYAIAIARGVIESVDDPSDLDRAQRLKLDLMMMRFGLPGGI